MLPERHPHTYPRILHKFTVCVHSKHNALQRVALPPNSIFVPTAPLETLVFIRERCCINATVAPMPIHNAAAELPYTHTQTHPQSTTATAPTNTSTAARAVRSLAATIVFCRHQLKERVYNRWQQIYLVVSETRTGLVVCKFSFFL